jgi:hypothetical protein
MKLDSKLEVAAALVATAQLQLEEAARVRTQYAADMIAALPFKVGDVLELPEGRMTVTRVTFTNDRFSSGPKTPPVFEVQGLRHRKDGRVGVVTNSRQLTVDPTRLRQSLASITNKSTEALAIEGGAS